jgi:pimeloyl-ACP methyl ester carboxylesterase
MPRITTSDIAMYYEDAGSGEPLILVSGLGGDSQGWANQVPTLSQRFRVITFDNRGAGRTGAPDKPYSIAGMATDLRNLMDTLGIESAHILGFSMGGYIAQTFAIANPKRVSKLILLATAAHIDGFGREVVRTWTSVRQASLSREEWVRFTGVWTYSPRLLDNERLFRAAIANALSNPYAQQDHAFLRQAAAIPGFDVRDEVKSLQCQTLVLAPEDDILVPKRNSELLASLIPNAQLMVLPGGHIGAMEYADEYNAAILGFLTGQSEG